MALWFQYAVGPAIVSRSGWIWGFCRWIPGLGNMMYHAWSDSCAARTDIESVVQVCAGHAGVYRPMSVAMWFFAILAAITKVQPQLNREAWPAKYTIFCFAVLFTLFMQNAPMFTGFYLWIARAGATMFVLMQQVILIDVAYNFNEDFVDRADQADRLLDGSGNTWLKAIVATCASFYALTLAGIVFLYKTFDGCAENTWIITLTLIAVVAMTGIQLSGPDGSLLTSSIISLYVTYLAYSMVSKNPNGACNPQLGSNDTTGIVIGLTLTAVSLAWTGWSWTAEERLNAEGIQSARTVSRPANNGGALSLDVPFLDPGDAPTSGMVMDAEEDEGYNSTSSRDSGIWKLNVVLVLISCWVSMILTGWGTTGFATEDETSTFHAANPTVGRFNMAMIGISQWCAILLYTWTLAAPTLFPDREFSY